MARESFASLAARAVFEDGLVLVDDEAYTVEEWTVKARQAAYRHEVRRLARLAREAGLG